MGKGAEKSEIMTRRTGQRGRDRKAEIYIRGIQIWWCFNILRSRKYEKKSNLFKKVYEVRQRRGVEVRGSDGMFKTKGHRRKGRNRDVKKEADRVAVTHKEIETIRFQTYSFD